MGDDELPPETVGRLKKQERGRSNLHAVEVFRDRFESPNLDLCLTSSSKKYQEVFGALPPPLSCKTLVQMHLQLKPQLEGLVVGCRPYPPSQDQINEVELQIQEGTDACLIKESKYGDYPRHCTLFFVVAKPGSTAMGLVVYFGEVKKKPRNSQGVSPRWGTP